MRMRESMWVLLMTPCHYPPHSPVSPLTERPGLEVHREEFAAQGPGLRKCRRVRGTRDRAGVLAGQITWEAVCRPAAR
jgi:hypothetical protein